MPKSAKFYGISVAVAGGLTIIAALAQWPGASWPLFSACLGLAVLGAIFKVRLPGLTGTLSPSFVPLLYAIGKATWQEAVLAAAVAGIVQCIWRAKRSPTLLQIAFNGSMLAISSGLAFAVSRLVGTPASLLQFAAAALIFHAVNTITLATMLGLLSGSRLRESWRSCHFWSFSYHLTGGIAAFIWAQAGLPISASVSLLVTIMLYLMNNYYAEWVRRIGTPAPMTSPQAG